MSTQNMIAESAINIISEGARIEGRIQFEAVARVHGTLVGEVLAQEGSTLILSETSVVEGNVYADVLLVDGYVRGDIIARKRVQISGTGRVIGNIKSPSISIDFGAYFEGRCNMEESAGLTLSPAPSLA